MKKSTKKTDANGDASQKAETASKAVASQNAEDLSTIREILFGEQHRQHNVRQDELEQFIRASIDELKADTHQQFKELNRKVDQLNTAMNKRLDKEMTAEVKARDKVTNSINTHIEQVESVIAALDDSTSATSNDLQDQLLNQADLMQQQMDDLYSEVTSALKEEVNRLSHDKADRTSLATLLSGIASQLSETGPGPGITPN